MHSSAVSPVTEPTCSNSKSYLTKPLSISKLTLVRFSSPVKFINSNFGDFGPVAVNFSVLLPRKT